MYVTDVHQEIREEDSIHDLVDFIWVRPHKNDGVFGVACNRPESMRHVWLNFMNSILWSRDPLNQ